MVFLLAVCLLQKKKKYSFCFKMEIFCIAFCSTWRYVVIIYGLRIQCTFIFFLKIWCFLLLCTHLFEYHDFVSLTHSFADLSVPVYSSSGALCHLTGYMVPEISRLHNVVIFKGPTAQEWIWPLKMRPLHHL